jgi:hypothetical protein
LVFTPRGGEIFSHRWALTPQQHGGLPGGYGRLRVKISNQYPLHYDFTLGGVYPPSRTAVFLGGGGLPPQQHGGLPGGCSGCFTIPPPPPLLSLPLAMYGAPRSMLTEAVARESSSGLENACP